MMAFVECQICKTRLGIDLNVATVSPESLGWRELPKWQASFEAYANGDMEVAPVCPRCLKSHSEIAEALFKDFAPFATGGGK